MKQGHLVFVYIFELVLHVITIKKFHETLHDDLFNIKSAALNSIQFEEKLFCYSRILHIIISSFSESLYRYISKLF